MMDDAALDRALFALELEEPPPDLRAGILAATVYKPAFPLTAWDALAIGVAAAIAVWLTLWVVFVPSSLGNWRHAMTQAIVWSASATPSLITAMGWLLLGVAATLTIVQLSPPRTSIER